jgi:hypothetical protein
LQEIKPDTVRQTKVISKRKVPSPRHEVVFAGMRLRRRKIKSQSNPKSQIGVEFRVARWGCD